jgi:thiol-disulfide isomerase/thioredoxin
MRVLIILLPVAFSLCLAGCDKASKPAGQEQQVKAAGQSDKNGASGKTAKPDDVGLESSNGMRANLTYANAGSAVPDAVFTGADGRDVQLSDFAGRPLLVNIWATWCAPCKAEMPTLDALAAGQEGKVSVIAVSQDLEGRKPVQAYFQSAKFANLEPYVDPDNHLLSALGTNVTLPTTILYDSDGKEVWRVMGGVEWDDSEMAKLIGEAK